ncbi:hypothetical protein [Brenneria goodwinii]|uniref:hypothetical protein n=2 Tax=Brenneria goodwinii TaxID=1109412 RepID=UPI0036F2E5A5
MAKTASMAAALAFNDTNIKSCLALKALETVRMKITGYPIAGDSEEVASIWAATLPLRMQKPGEEILLLPTRR